MWRFYRCSDSAFRGSQHIPGCIKTPWHKGIFARFRARVVARVIA
jgi:hypothetical protein